jgi:hypothetical protein
MKRGDTIEINDWVDSESKKVVENAGPSQPWLRRRDESETAYHAFCLYRDSEQRVLKHVAAELHCSVPNVSRWATRYDWKGRSWDFDQIVYEQQCQQLALGRVQMKQRQLKLALELQEIAIYALRELQARMERGEPLGLTPEQIVALAKVGSDIERKALGEEEKNKYTKIQVNLYETPDDPEPALPPNPQQVN